MTRLDIERVQAALAPLRSALLARATAEAAQEVAEAQRQADSLVTQAYATAQADLETAASLGRSDAETVIVAHRSRARRAARLGELAAQREVYDELHRRVTAAMARLADEPALRDRLVAQVRAVLGPDATVLDVPGGGVIGHMAGRRVDFSLRAAAERAVNELGAGVRELWAP